jgi:hypothetical protein
MNLSAHVPKCQSDRITWSVYHLYGFCRQNSVWSWVASSKCQVWLVGTGQVQCAWMSSIRLGVPCLVSLLSCCWRFCSFSQGHLPRFWVDCYKVMYTHCWELMKSVGSHGSSLLLFCDGLMLCEQLSYSYDCTHCHVNFKLWRFLCNFKDM